jgi:hypothetical protein
VSTGLYFWANQPATGASGEQAADVELTPELREYLRSARATPETFYAITLPAWNELTEEKKEEVLEKTREFANTKGLRTVRLLNTKGDLEAFGSPQRSDILRPIP